MRCEYDLFISYGSPEKQEDESSNQWASKFCELLAILLNRISNRELTVMTHDDLRSRKQLLGTESPAVLGKTAVFVTILSPEYGSSESYQKELQEIFNAVYEGSDDSGRKVNRIFKVLTAPVALEEQPGCLKNEIEYNFFEINRYNKKSRTFDMNEGEQPEEKFWFKLMDLAYDIQNTLDLYSGDDPHNFDRKKFVYLAETSIDQTENRDEIRRELQHLGYNILPLINLPSDGDRIESLVKNYLGRSVLSVHLMGGMYGEFVKNSKHSMLDLQSKIVREYIQTSTSNLKRIIWIPSDLKTNDQRQSLYLNRLKRDESREETEIIEAPLEVFKNILRNKIQELDNPGKKSTKRKKVYLIYDKASKAELQDLKTRLSEQEIDSLELDLDVQVPGLITAHKQNLVNADAVLIYQGSSNSRWISSKVRDLVKAPGFGKEKPFTAVGIIARDDTDDNITRFLHGTEILRSKSLDETFSRNFLSRIINQ